MPVVSCPKCATGLRVPDGATGTIRCPKCQTTFGPPPAKPAAAPPKAAPKPPPPKPAARPAPAAEDPDFDPVDAPPKPRPAAPAAGKKGFSLDDAVRSADKQPTARRAPEKAPPPPRRDDREDDRPRGRRDRDEEYDDDDDRRDDRAEDDYDDRPERRPRKPSKYGAARPAALLLLISLGLHAGSMGLYTLFILVAWMGVALPGAMEVMTGVLGLAGWVVGLAGLGTAIAGPAKARGLVIAALVVSVLHLTMAVVVANKGSSILFGHGAVGQLSAENRIERIQDIQKDYQKEFQANPASARTKALQAEMKALTEEPRAGRRIRITDDSTDFFGGEMRWTDMLTTLPRLDKLLAVLVYSPKAFEYYVWGLLAGMLELARLILLCLALAALARAVKDYRAETLAKFGWIGGAAAVGVSALVVLLAAVFAESAAKSAVRTSTGNPPEMPRMQFTPPAGGDFNQQRAEMQRQQDEWRRQMDEYHRQQQAEGERIMERGRSIGRTIRFWNVSSELLTFLLHTGALVTPILAAWGIFAATGRR